MLAYLRLFRLPNVFTAIADVVMGFVLVQRGVAPLSLMACLAAASALLYTAGMVLNDVFDVEVDRQERPSRPIPSGQVPLGQARLLGWLMLGLGLLLGWVASLAFAPLTGGGYRTGAVATLLAGAIVLYDAWLKRTPLGPLGMGLCRFLNVLLGASAAVGTAPVVAGFDAAPLLAAAGIGTYIVGVTWFSRNEAEESQPALLLAALAVMVLGGGILASFAAYDPGPLLLKKEGVWLLFALLVGTVVRRCGMAVGNPEPANVQGAVRHAILSLILFDAAVCLPVAGAAIGLAVVALLVPTLILARWVYST